MVLCISVKVHLESEVATYIISFKVGDCKLLRDASCNSGLPRAGWATDDEDCFGSGCHDSSVNEDPVKFATVNKASMEEYGF